MFISFHWVYKSLNPSRFCLAPDLEVLWTPKMYKWEKSLGFQILKWFCDFPVVWAPPGTLQGTDHFPFLVNPFSKITQDQTIRRPNTKGLSSQAKLVLQLALVFFFKFHVKKNTSQPKLTVENMSIKKNLTGYVGIFLVALFSKSWCKRKANLPISSHKLQETRGCLDLWSGTDLFKENTRHQIFRF